MKLFLPAALGGLLSAHLSATDLHVSMEIPRLSVAEYHRPYVAMWIETPDQAVAVTLSVWYDQQQKKTEAGSTWLKDLRQWWRKSGRELKMPVDGITGATRAPGTHSVVFRGGKAPLADLKPGSYSLVVEAVREVGGRELLRIPFEWKAGASQSAKAQGQHEIGAVAMDLKP